MPSDLPQAAKLPELEKDFCFLTFLMSMLGRTMGHTDPRSHGAMREQNLVSGPALSEALRQNRGLPAAGWAFLDARGLDFLLITPKKETEENSALVLHGRKDKPPPQLTFTR